jgi:hypothetical protein
VLSNGTMVESATAGNEGMLGIEAQFSADVIAQSETIIQVPDTSAEMLTVDAFRCELAHRAALHDIIGRYAQRVLLQAMQSTGAMHCTMSANAAAAGCCRRSTGWIERTSS